MMHILNVGQMHYLFLYKRQYKAVLGGRQYSYIPIITISVGRHFAYFCLNHASYSNNKRICKPQTLSPSLWSANKP